MSEKNFKTLDEQIDILKFKGLIINNLDYTKEVLIRENYFFLNGYRHIFMKSINNRKFIEGTTFEELYSLFLFDRSFRNILFKNILIIENNIKSIISYQMSKKYGFKENDYLRSSNFNTEKEKARQVSDLLKKMKRQIAVNQTQHSATMHYVNNYGYIPMWVLVKVLSFGIVGEMFSILKREDQEDISKIYNIDIESLIIYLPILANYRNLCAHEDIVFENRTQKEINDTKIHQILNIAKMDNEYIYGKTDTYALIIIIKRMLKDDEVKHLINELERELDNLEYNLKTIPISKVLDRMGFPTNWKEIGNIEKREL